MKLAIRLVLKEGEFTSQTLDWFIGKSKKAPNRNKASTNLEQLEKKSEYEFLPPLVPSKSDLKTFSSYLLKYLKETKGLENIKPTSKVIHHIIAITLYAYYFSVTKLDDPSGWFIMGFLLGNLFEELTDKNGDLLTIEEYEDILGKSVDIVRERSTKSLELFSPRQKLQISDGRAVTALPRKKFAPIMEAKRKSISTKETEKVQKDKTPSPKRKPSSPIMTSIQKISMKELRKICNENKEIIGKCGGPGVTKKSLYKKIVDAGLLDPKRKPSPPRKEPKFEDISISSRIIETPPPSPVRESIPSPKISHQAASKEKEKVFKVLEKEIIKRFEFILSHKCSELGNTEDLVDLLYDSGKEKTSLEVKILSDLTNDDKCILLGQRYVKRLYLDRLRQYGVTPYGEKLFNDILPKDKIKGDKLTKKSKRRINPPIEDLTEDLIEQDSEGYYKHDRDIDAFIYAFSDIHVSLLNFLGSYLDPDLLKDSFMPLFSTLRRMPLILKNTDIFATLKARNDLEEVIEELEELEELDELSKQIRPGR